ncbi:hypothetical protein DC31_02135 [Microbacterium sp. CH12i]|nr:hypothetical protein DC31_02135 [Microbacterium sp. CH12i]
MGSMVSGLSSSTVLERRRLIDALSSPARLVVLVGPVGSGATTLLRQWAAQWSAQYEDVTWAWSGSIPDAPGDVLILDDADALDTLDWEQIHDLRRARPQLLIRAAAHSHRAVPAGEEAEFVHGLSFTALETSEYLAALSSHLESAAVQLVTGGLPAAVRAVAQLKTVRPALVNEVLAELRPGGLQPQHARFAIPQVLTHELVANLGGPPDFIARVESEGLGEWMADAGHPLFLLTAPVRAATLKAHPADDAQEVREQAGRVLLAQSAWFGALVEGAASGALSVVDAALRGGGMMLLRMHGPSIRALLRSIHPWELRRWPITAMALAVIHNARNEHRLRAIEFMGIALVGARSAPAGSAERALLRVIESVLQRLLGIGDGGVKAARAAARIVDELPADEHQAIEGLLGDIHTHSAISLMYGGQAIEAVAEFERAHATAERPGLQLISFGGVATIHALSGDLTAGQDWVDTALKSPWSISILNEYQGALLRIAQAKIYLENDQLDDADAALDSVWHIIDTIEHWPLLAHLRAMIDICRGQAGEGLERFRSLRRRRGTRMPRSQARLLDLTESSLALAFGELSAAAVLTARPGDLPQVAVGVARAEMFGGRYDRALRILAAISADGPEVRASIAVLEAIGLRRLGRPADAAVAARRSRAVADAHGLKTPFLLVPAEDRDLFGEVTSWEPPAAGIGEPTPRLTEREWIILRALVDTASVNAIAERLHVSVNTVKSQRRTLYRKLGATSREEVLAIAVGQGLLSGSGR